MIADLPPPPAIGDNSRHFDIMRTADEIRIRSEYTNAFVVPAKSYKWKVLHSANNSDMSDSAFRMLFTYLAFAKEDGTESYPSQKRVAIVTRKAERTATRATKELEKSEWLKTERKRRGTSMRSVTIPDFVAGEIMRQYLEETKLAELRGPLEVPNLAPLKQDQPKLASLEVKDQPKVADQEPLETPNLVSTGDKNGLQTIDSNHNKKTTQYRTREVYQEIEDKIRAACGDALCAASPGLLVLSEPFRWLDNDCDMETDILPTLRKVSLGKPKHQIRTWSFFSAAVQEARDRRLMPMAAPISRPGEKAAVKPYRGRPGR